MLKFLAVVPQHPKQTSDPSVQIVVDLDGGRRLVQQNRGGTAEWFDVGLMNWKLLDDLLAQVVFAPMPFGGRSQLRHELFMPVRSRVFGGLRVGLGSDFVLDDSLSHLAKSSL